MAAMQDLVAEEAQAQPGDTAGGAVEATETAPRGSLVTWLSYQPH